MPALIKPLCAVASSAPQSAGSAFWNVHADFDREFLRREIEGFLSDQARIKLAMLHAIENELRRLDFEFDNALGPFLVVID
jgi:hypothetical protein